MAKGRRSFIVTVETRLFRKPIIKICDGSNDIVIFGSVGGIEVDTDVPFPKRIMRKFY